MMGGVPGRMGSARGVPPTPPNSIFEYSNIDVAISVPKKNEKKLKKVLTPERNRVYYIHGRNSAATEETTCNQKGANVCRQNN